MTPQDPNAILLAQGSIGADADDFMKSELGRTMIGLARIESKVAMDSLKTISPTQSQEIRELQNQVWLAERFEGWLVQLIMRGRQALAQYDVRTSDSLQGEDDHGQETATQPPANED